MEVKLRCLAVSPGRTHPRTVETENISRSGVLMIWPQPPVDGAADLPSPGDALEVEIQLPANHTFGQKCMFCDGHVVRVSNGGGEYRVAMQIRHMEFRPSTTGQALTAAGGPMPQFVM